jgi:ABC-type branched-subunit amino acid transport system substrate-binding protein
VTFAVACALLGLAACSSSSKSKSAAGQTAGGGATSTTVACAGTPLKFGVITPLAGNAQTPASPYVGDGAKAAAQALTSSCALGLPVQAVVCDTKANPNDAAACGRQMVSEKVVGFIGVDSFGPQWFPITKAAGIPEIGGNGLDSLQVSDPLWFPLAGNIHDALTLTTIAASAEAPNPLKLAVIQFDIPGVDFFVNFFKKQVAQLGGQYAGTFVVPLSATDMSQYAAQAIQAGANAVVPIIGGDQYSGLIQQFVQQNKPLTQLAYLALGSGQVDCKTRSQLGSALNGIWISSDTWPVGWDTTNPGARQYVDELKAAGLNADPCNLNEFGVQAWSAVHIMADLLKGSSTMDSATLVQRLNSGGPINRPELAGAIDFSKNPYASDPVLGKLRIFTDKFYVSRVVNGKPKVELTGPATIGTVFKPTS